MGASEIAVWYDGTDRDQAGWVVSLESGETSHTVSVHEDRDTAVAAAFRLQARRSLPVVEVGQHGERSELLRPVIPQ